jgi:hypothetical protein
VVPSDADGVEPGYDLDALIRVWPVADQIASDQVPVDARAVELAQNRPQRMEVPVDVGEDPVAHLNYRVGPLSPTDVGWALSPPSSGPNTRARMLWRSARGPPAQAASGSSHAKPDLVSQGPNEPASGADSLGPGRLEIVGTAPPDPPAARGTVPIAGPLPGR